MSEWTSLFSERGSLSLQSENIPILDWANTSVLEEDEDTEDENEDGTEGTDSHLDEGILDVEPGEAGPDEEAPEPSMIRQILDSPTANDNLYMAEKLDSFCCGTDLASVRDGATEASRRPVAWLYDRSSNEGVHRSKPDMGLLSSRQLYENLSRLRFPSVSRTSQASLVDKASLGGTGEASVTSDRDGCLQGEMDAECRSIFIPDLDSSYIYALLGTASKNQASSLIEGIYKHLLFEPFFTWKTLGPEGPAVLHLAFHLPYYSWRNSSLPRSDHRKYRDGIRLRNVYDISFLNLGDCQSPSFLYEAQISCIIVAPRDWMWTSYCFCDSFFESAKTRAELRHNGEVHPSTGSRADPFRNGRLISGDQFRDPREYFLEIFNVRLRQIAGEWRQFVEKLRDSISNYEQGHLELLKLHGRTVPEEAQERDAKIRQAENYVLQARSFTCKALLPLSQTVEACERFCRTNERNFEKTAVLAKNFRLVHSESQPLGELRQIERTLKSLEKSYDVIARDLAYFQQHKTLNISNCQSEWTRLSVTTMLCMSPIVLAVGFLSMQKEIIPFRSLTPASFLYMTVIFGALGLMVYFSFGCLIHFCRPFNFWVRRPFRTSSGHGNCNNKTTEANLGIESFGGSRHSAAANRVQEDLEHAAPRRILGRNIVSRWRHATDPPSGT